MLSLDSLTSNILTALETSANSVDGKTNDPSAIRQQLATDLATAIDTYVRSIEVTSTVSGVADASSVVTGTATTESVA